MHDLRGNFFLNGKRRRGKERRIGEGKRGNEGGRGGKGGGEKGEWHREAGGNETENTHKENTEKAQRERKAQGRRKKGRKDDKEEEVPGRKARKENIGHVSGAVHKGKIKGKGKGRKKGGGTGARKGGYYWTEDAHKESMEDALEQRNELERKNGWGGKDCKKEKTLEQRAHTRKARKMHKKPHMKTPHIY